jgi:site-specific DNA recombinase
VKTGIYARISSDTEGRSLGVKRQVADCEREAKRRGWEITQRFIDNDVSATRSKVRTEYVRMIRAVEAGDIEAVIVWDVDRLTRTPRELEDIIDLADKHGLTLANVGGEIDLSTPQGRLTARLKGSVARHETEQQSKRIRRKFDERAAEGQPHGAAPYGYLRLHETSDAGRRLSSTNVINEPEAALTREAAARLIAGDSLYAIAVSFNERGALSPRGKPWVATTLRQVLGRASNAGLRVHRGQVIGRSNSQAILDEDDYNAVLAVLADPSRKTGSGGKPRHLLSGIAECGKCGGSLVRAKGAARPAGGFGADAYFCRHCHGVRRSQAPVDALVEAVVLERLSRRDAQSALAKGDPKAERAARKTITTMEARLALAADQFAEGHITGPQLKRITARLRPQIEAAQRTIARSAGNEIIGAIVSGREKWETATLDRKRAVIQSLMRIVVMPSGPGKSFDPDLIQIHWHKQ